MLSITYGMPKVYGANYVFAHTSLFICIVAVRYRCFMYLKLNSIRSAWETTF
jgi:hypothetical protein